MWSYIRRKLRLDKIELLLYTAIGGEHIMSQELDDLTAQVAANTSIEESAITLIKGLHDQIVAAGTDPAKLAALTASLKVEADKLAEAISANTAPPTP